MRPGPDLPEGAFVVDPVFGRAVFVPDRILAKIERDHGAYFTPRRDDAPDPREGRHRYWCFVADRGRWVFVVVDYHRVTLGEVITAFPRRRLPPLT